MKMNAPTLFVSSRYPPRYGLDQHTRRMMALAFKIPMFRVALAPRDHVRPTRRHLVDAGFNDVTRQPRLFTGRQLPISSLRTAGCNDLADDKQSFDFSRSLPSARAKTMKHDGQGQARELGASRPSLAFTSKSPAQHHTTLLARLTKTLSRSGVRSAPNWHKRLPEESFDQATHSLAPVESQDFVSVSRPEPWMQHERLFSSDIDALTIKRRLPNVASSWRDRNFLPEDEAGGADAASSINVPGQMAGNSSIATLHVDGAALGRWTIQHLTRVMSRPVSGITSVDPRSIIPRARVAPF